MAMFLHLMLLINDCTLGDDDAEESIVVQQKPKNNKKKKLTSTEHSTQTASVKGKTAAATVVLKGFKKGVTKTKLQRLLKQRLET